jgi:microcystin-dependent protein
LVSRVTYAKLFAVIGTYWNAGDGGTTFGLPNMNGRSGVGPGTFIDESGASYTLGFTNLQGFVTRTITQAYLPAYNLVTDSQGFHNHGSGTGPAGAHGHTTDAQGFHSHGGSSLPNHIHTGTTDLQGDHNHTYSMAAEGVGAAGGGFTIASGTTFGFPVFNTSTNGAHQHNVTTAAIGSLSLAIVGDGSHGHTISTVADHNHVIGTDGAHTHNVNLGGGGTSLKTLSPIAVVTKIIYAGQEAAIVTATDIAPAATSTDTHAEIENLREEIAALRALFETPRARMLSAPSRGPH